MTTNKQDFDGNLWLEIVIRFVLFLIFVETERLQPFHRKVHMEELWLYRNPRTESYVPVTLLWPIVILVPICIVFCHNMLRKKTQDSYQAALSFSLALGLNGIFTNTMKLCVGRPRPDFFWRCFPDGNSNQEMNCTGNVNDVIEGYKSFPSGHSSFAFTSMGFSSLYLAGKLFCFNHKGRGQSWRFCLALAPLLMAVLIAISRTADYHHHWQDVLAGSLLGSCIAYLCYYQYYPSLTNTNCDLPLSFLHSTEVHQLSVEQETKYLESVKWI